MIPEPSISFHESSRVRSDVAMLRDLPARLCRILDGVDADGLVRTYRQGGWTVARIVHHLVDSHMHSYMRCKFALCERNPSIRPYDENAWVATPECSVDEARSASSLLAHLHARWVRMLAGLDDSQWNRAFHHPERGCDFRLFQQAGIYAWHGEHHLAQIALALGKEMPE